MGVGAGEGTRTEYTVPLKTWYGRKKNVANRLRNVIK